MNPSAAAPPAPLGLFPGRPARQRRGIGASRLIDSYAPGYNTARQQAASINPIDQRLAKATCRREAAQSGGILSELLRRQCQTIPREAPEQFG